MKNLLLIGLGGFLGSVARYLLSTQINLHMHHALPLGTLAVNVVGSFVIGLLLASVMKQHEPLSFVFITGFCGGFTTFSAFSAENMKYLMSGQYGTAFLYSVISLLSTIAVCFLGFYISRKLFS